MAGEVTVTQWRVHVELQASSLADDLQLAGIAARLSADRGLVDAAPSSASLGSRYSITVALTVEASDSNTAQQHATTALRDACAVVGITVGKILARGIITE